MKSIDEFMRTIKRCANSIHCWVYLSEYMFNNYLLMKDTSFNPIKACTASSDSLPLDILLTDALRIEPEKLIVVRDVNIIHSTENSYKFRDLFNITLPYRAIHLFIDNAANRTCINTRRST